jgi:uncharacterized protein YcbX
MRGEELQEAFLGFAGVYGDRVYAFRSAAAPVGFPYLTGREQEQMLRYQPVFRHPGSMALPVNLAQAEALPPGATPLYAEAAERMVDVKTPAGEVLSVDDARLVDELRTGIGEKHKLTLLQSDRAMTDCRPVSLFSVQTVRQLSRELGFDLDKRRFRANIYIDLESGDCFKEEEFINRTLRIGEKASVGVMDRDPRCKMITLDPDTAQANPDVLRLVARSHGGNAGVYAAVLIEGTIRRGDQIALLD